MKSSFNGQLKFINHACFYIESSNSILICDPWLEGLAFNNGWSLLDESSSNNETIEDLIRSKKKIFIWYSHEHSDHFSISFLKDLYKKFKNFTVIFQKTLDRRIIKYLKSKNISSIEATNGNKILLDNQLFINIWSHKNGDSFSLITYKNITILNLNDCIINNKKEAQQISYKLNKITKKINFLFTQFGYANWIGNKENKEIRLKAGAEKINRILLQENQLSPEIIIPFASFITFCHKDNFYLNDYQNTPKIIKNSHALKSIRDKIIFLKPRDIIDLKKYKNLLQEFETFSNNAIDHWEKLYFSKKPISFKSKSIEFEILKNEAKKFLVTINKNFLLLPSLLELFKLIRPVSIYIKDIDEEIHFSYLKFSKIHEKTKWDIKTNSQELYHSLKYEYGFNTLNVNGKFEVNSFKSYKNFVYFFYFQDLIKQNITFKNPFNLLKKILHLSMIFIRNTSSFSI